MSLLKFPITGIVTRIKGKTAAGIGSFGVLFVGSPLNSPADTPLSGLAYGLFPTYGAPTSGTSGTYAKEATPGSLLVDVENKVTYQNMNTQASPTWTQLGSVLFGPASISQTVSSTTPPTTHVLESDLSITGATVAVAGNSNMVAMRGAVTIGGSTTLNSGYFYGVEGKVVCPGTVVLGSDYLCGVLGQLDWTSMTPTSGHIAAVIASLQNTSGSTPTAVLDGIYVESNCPANINSVLKAIANTAYVIDIAVDSGSPSAYALTSSSVTGGGTEGWLKVHVGGQDRYIALANAVS